MFVIKIVKMTDEAVIPYYAHEGDAGTDLFSIDDIVINPGEIQKVRTGICIELPENTEAQIRPRSGLALKDGITVLNTPGTVDESYRGEICVILINHGKVPFHICKQMKIAQMVIQPIYKAAFLEVDQLSETKRGERGFGSTGIISREYK